MSADKKKFNQEILLNCLDVLCRANATVFESDPKLAADITQAIEALSDSLNSDDSLDETTSEDAGITQQESKSEPFVFEEENGILDVFSIKTLKEAQEKISELTHHGTDEIVDVLTNEVIKKK
ncbi:MAG: hypothetical protein KQH63_16930 [Desulfobulbaceae bacterium]|nr:hypothetical protein [Desulfobulbaceae bacterium]